mgnify:CR=1 FL=1
MKDFCMLLGFGAGLVAGALLYKHSQDAKQIVNKGEEAVMQEVENMKEMVKGKKTISKSEQSKPQTQQN